MEMVFHWLCFISGQAEPCYQVETAELLRHWDSGQFSFDQEGKDTSTRITKAQGIKLSKGKSVWSKILLSPGQSSASASFREDKSHHFPFTRPGPPSSVSPPGCRHTTGPAHLVEGISPLLRSSILASASRNGQLRTS